MWRVPDLYPVCPSGAIKGEKWELWHGAGDPL